MTAVRWERFVYLAVGLVILGSVLFFIGFLMEDRLDVLSASSSPGIAGGLPLRHVGFALTVAGNLILILFLFVLSQNERWDKSIAFAKAEGSGELVYGFRFTFILLLILGLVSALLLGKSIFSPTINLLLWLMGLFFPWIIRLVLFPIEERLPRGEMGVILRSLLVVCWGLLLLQVLISLIATFPPPLSNIVLSGLLTGLGVVGILVLHR